MAQLSPSLFSSFSSFSPSRPFLIEGVLVSKNLFSESFYIKVISFFWFGGSKTCLASPERGRQMKSYSNRKTYLVEVDRSTYITIEKRSSFFDLGTVSRPRQYWRLGRDDFQKNFQIFLGIGLPSSVMLRWTLVLIKYLKIYQKVQHKLLLWCEILIWQNCRFMRYCTFKISIFCICVRVRLYVLCLQRLLCINIVLFYGTRFSTHETLWLEKWIWSQILQYYKFFHLFI